MLSNEEKRYLKKYKLKCLTDIGLYMTFFKDAKIIGITGTFGKTTITRIITGLLNKNGYKVVACGNIGIPIFDINANEYDYLICECSSFELEYAAYFNPRIMIFLNIYPHHLNYHLTFKAYKKAKISFIKNKISTVIYNKAHFKFKNGGKTHVYEDEPFKDGQVMTQFTKDELININSVFMLSKYLKIDKSKVIDYLSNFRKDLYRNEVIYKSNDHLIINDAKSTSLYAFLSAKNNLESFRLNRTNIYILGGKKAYNMVKILNKERIEWNENSVIYVYGENKMILYHYFKHKVKVFIGDNIEEIINNLKFDKPFNLLYSPGAQSYDMFKSYEERGKVFTLLILKKLLLKGKE